MIAEELQVAGVVRRDQHLQKQPAEQRRENLHRQKIARSAARRSQLSRSDLVLLAHRVGGQGVELMSAFGALRKNKDGRPRPAPTRLTRTGHCRTQETQGRFRRIQDCAKDLSLFKCRLSVRQADWGWGIGKMRRREFLTLLGGTAACLPLKVLAQQNAPLVGFLNSASPDTYRFNADSFREGLAKAGFVEGRNIRIEERWARGDYGALPTLAAELVAAGVVAIAATGDVASARAAQGASSTVPVVFTIGGDPVRFGLVKSLNRPGGHVTGILFNQNVLGAKRVELLREIAPNVSRVALLMNPTNANVDIELTDAEAGARKLGLETVTLNARNAREIDTAFEQLLAAKADGIITATDPITLDRREQIVSFANRHKLPIVGFVRQFAAVGALLSYGPSISWMYRQAGDYVAQILKGASPAELPVLQPTQFELVINLKTAQALGLTVPITLQSIANEVIE
jgi:putative ABC transport system substrate-binding protein